MRQKKGAVHLAQRFEEIVPDYSKDKVYNSDIKKVAQWYNILHKLDLLIKEEPETTAEKETAPVAKKKKRKATPKTKAE
ncbi:MAG: hypothetical protein NTV31_13095 [Bacteroidia bacterium]|nr:hypothetical protein [Bacteroidia bacterium]